MAKNQRTAVKEKWQKVRSQRKMAKKSSIRCQRKTAKNQRFAVREQWKKIKGMSRKKWQKNKSSGLREKWQKNQRSVLK